MKHIYIFNEDTRAGTYGIGTYVYELANALLDNNEIVCHVVLITSKYEEFKVDIYANLIYYYIPFNEQIKSSQRYYRNIFYLLYSNFENSYSNTEISSTIFHFNYYHHRPIMEYIKIYFPESIICFTIHQFDWYFHTKGSRSYFQSIINNNDNVFDEIECNVMNDYIYTKKVFELSDKIISLSDYTREMLINDYNINELKMFRINNFLTATPFVLSSIERNNVKLKLHIEANEYIILYVGRLDFVKGVEVLIKSFRRLVDTYFINARLFIVGDGDFSKYLKLSEGLWSKITFTGKLEKNILASLYQIADIGVMPSLHEQCSYVAIEMLSYGIPLVAATSTGLTEMIPFGLREYMLDFDENEREPVFSLEQCAYNILQILQLDEVKKKELSNIARNKFIESYSIDGLKKRIVELYD